MPQSSVTCPNSSSYLDDLRPDDVSGLPASVWLQGDQSGAAVFLMQHYDEEGIINVGVGEDQTIRELAERIAATVGFAGELSFVTSKPDGTPQKRLDVSRLFSLGWRPQISLPAGLRQTYAWDLEHTAIWV